MPVSRQNELKRNDFGDRSNVVSVRLSREEYRIISQEAARNGMSISEYMRTQAVQDNASSLDQLRIEVRQQEEILEHIIFMMEMMQQTAMEFYSDLMKRLLKLEGGQAVGEGMQEYMKRLEAEVRTYVRKALDRAVDKEVALHVTGDWDSKDPLRLQQYEQKIKEYMDKESERELN